MRRGYNGRSIWWIPGSPKPDLEKLDRKEVILAQLEAGKTSRGGWTRAQLAEWGVPWPLPHGWRRWILENGFPYRGPGDLVA